MSSKFALAFIMSGVCLLPLTKAYAQDNIIIDSEADAVAGIEEPRPVEFDAPKVDFSQTPMVDNKGVLSVSFENDIFTGADQHYTNGFRMSYTSPENVPGITNDFANLFPFFRNRGRRRVTYSFGQNMYTPREIEPAIPDPEDRPYAGWLYGSVGLTSDTGSRLDNLELTLGVVGPASMAEETQKLIHDTFWGRDPGGWDYQLENEPGIILSYDRKWKYKYQFDLGGFGVDATPGFGANIGNVYTDANVGVTFRFGQDLPRDYSPPLIRPSIPGSDFFVPTNKLGWYLFAGANQRAVARNIFLDGNTFTDSPSVDKEYFVTDFQQGIALTYDDWRLSFTHVIRSPEFKEQGDWDRFAGVSVSHRF